MLNPIPVPTTEVSPYIPTIQTYNLKTPEGQGRKIQKLCFLEKKEEPRIKSGICAPGASPCDLVWATTQHAFSLLPFLEKRDQLCFFEAGAKNFEESLFAALDYSEEKYTILQDGYPLGILGIGPSQEIPGVGIPWFFSSRRIEQNAFFLRRVSHAAVEHFQSRYKTLMAYCDLHAHRMVRWLRQNNFESVGAMNQERGLNQPFYKFVRTVEKRIAA